MLTTAQRLEAVVELAAGEQPLSAAADARRADALREVSRAVRDAFRLAFAACAAGTPISLNIRVMCAIYSLRVATERSSSRK